MYHTLIVHTLHLLYFYLNMLGLIKRLFGWVPIDILQFYVYMIENQWHMQPFVTLVNSQYVVYVIPGNVKVIKNVRNYQQTDS